MSAPVTLEPGLRRLRAPNPSPMTFTGTNTYLLGQDRLAVIDPGPDDPAHLEAILAAAGDAGIGHILVTHAHLDHSPLARPLSRATSAPVLAFGGPRAGRSEIMSSLGEIGGGEGVDSDFVPDETLADGETIEGDGWSVSALWTPGHFGNHLCFAWNDAVFTGDLVMGWASSLVSPPDGDLTDFMASCARLALRSDRIFYPGHGDPVADPSARLGWLIAHRRGREAQILEALASGPASADELAARIYTEVAPQLLPAASRNVLAHLVDLASRSLVTPSLPLTGRSLFSRP